MPLSEHEQRLLEQIEQSLYAEDPKFSATVKSTDVRALSAKRIRVGIALVVLGLAVLVGGVWLNNVFVGVLGFLIMFGGGVLGVIAAQAPAAPPGPKKSGQDPPPPKSTVKDRFEERLRKRFDQ